MCKCLVNVQMWECANVQIVAFVQLSLSAPICTLTTSSTNAATKCAHSHICTFAHLHIFPICTLTISSTNAATKCDHLHICTFAHLHISPHLHICTFAHLHIPPHLHICTFAHLHIPLGKPPYEACPLLRVSAWCYYSQPVIVQSQRLMRCRKLLQ